MSVNILRAIEALEGGKKAFAELLDEVPDLALMVDHQLTMAINRLRAAHGATAGHSTVDKSAEGANKMTHLFGTSIGTKQVRKKVSDAKPSADELTDMDILAIQAMDEFLIMDAQDLKEKYGDLVIRAVAAKVGIPVTATDPAKITVDFIESIKTKLTDNGTREMQISEANTAADKTDANVITLDVAHANVQAANDKCIKTQATLDKAKEGLTAAQKAVDNLPKNANAGQTNAAKNKLALAQKVVDDATKNNSEAIAAAKEAQTVLDGINQ